MKLQILTNPKEEIKGYKTYNLGQINLISEEVADNECESIIASNTLNLFSEQEVINFLNLLVGKLRIGGELVVSGIEQRLLCKNILLGTIDQTTVNQIILQSRSIVDQELVNQFLQSVNLQIEHSKISGITYEIRAKRK